MSSAFTRENDDSDSIEDIGERLHVLQVGRGVGSVERRHHLGLQRSEFLVGKLGETREALCELLHRFSPLLGWMGLSVLGLGHEN